jgi:hypothetical protein
MAARSSPWWETAKRKQSAKQVAAADQPIVHLANAANDEDEPARQGGQADQEARMKHLVAMAKKLPSLALRCVATGGVC